MGPDARSRCHTTTLPKQDVLCTGSWRPKSAEKSASFICQRTCTLNVQQNSSIVNLALLLFILVFLQPLLLAILLPERLIIRLLPDSVPPIIKMLSSWGQALSLAILTLNVTCIVAINLGSIEGEASRLIGDLQGDFEDFEQAVQSELSKALVNSDGVLAQFSIEHQTYATRPIAPTMETSLTANTEYHLSALDL
jgi:hypothetical protein